MSSKCAPHVIGTLVLLESGVHVVHMHMRMHVRATCRHMGTLYSLRAVYMHAHARARHMSSHAMGTLLLEGGVHVVHLLLVLLEHLRPLELESGCEQVLLNAEHLGLQVHGLDHLKALQLVGLAHGNQLLRCGADGWIDSCRGWTLKMNVEDGS